MTQPAARIQRPSHLGPVRRALAACGLTPSGTPSAGGLGRAEDASIRPGELVEDATLQIVSCGPPGGCPEPLAFLDGIQRHLVVAYCGPSPLVLGWVAAGVLLRVDRELRVAGARVAQMAIGRAAVLDRASSALAGFESIPMEPPDDLHPAHDLDLARGLIDRRRVMLEGEVASTFRAASEAWLLVDGGLSHDRALAVDSRALGIAKSHATLPFDGVDLTRYLHLPEGCRTSLFRPKSRGETVYSWGLRLRDWTDRDPFHGLVRVEAAAADSTRHRVDEFSRWILAERAPISVPDARWDRQLYGMRAVERYLGTMLGA